MLFKKLCRTMKLYKAQFLSMIIMITLGVGIFVGFNMEWVSIRDNTTEFFEATGFADYRLVSTAGFSTEELENVRAIDGVDAAARFLSVTADVAGQGGDSVALTVTTDPAVSGFYLMDGAPYDEANTDGIWLSEQYAKANGFALGDPLTLTYKGLSIEGTVCGLIKSGEYMICVRDETQLMPDFSTYGFAYISPAMYEKTVGMAFYPQVNVRSTLEKKDFIDRVDAALGVTPLVLTKDETMSYSGASGETEEGQTMGSILPVLFLLIAVLTMVTTMHRIAAKEKTQIGTLKALGFRDKRILRHYSCYALLIGAVGSAEYDSRHSALQRSFSLRWPRLPPGCHLTYWVGVTAASLCSRTLSACSTSSSATIDARGARLRGPPSCSACASRCTSLCPASHEAALPLMPMTLQPLLRTAVTVAFISAVSPLLEMKITISPGTSWPHEPCTASVPCRKYAGVPVEDSSDAA